MEGQIASVILAAGKGMRMESQVPKVIHKVCGKPMLLHLLNTLEGLQLDRNIVVTGYRENMVRDILPRDINYVHQPRQLGTGDAVKQSAQALEDFNGAVLVLCGDTPLLTRGTLLSLIEAHEQGGHDVTILSTVFRDPKGYGRIVRGAAGEVRRIVEEKDASPEERAIREINAGAYVFGKRRLFQSLAQVQPNPKKGEYYLTDVVGIINREGGTVGSWVCKNPTEVLGINNRKQLARAEKILKTRIIEQLQKAGVTVFDPGTTFVGVDVRIGYDTIIQPLSFIDGLSSLGKNCEIGPNATISSSRIGNNVQIKNSVIEHSEIESGAIIRPFTYIRENRVMQWAAVGV